MHEVRNYGDPNGSSQCPIIQKQAGHLLTHKHHKHPLRNKKTLAITKPKPSYSYSSTLKICPHKKRPMSLTLWQYMCQGSVWVMACAVSWKVMLNSWMVWRLEDTPHCYARCIWPWIQDVIIILLYFSCNFNKWHWNAVVQKLRKKMKFGFFSQCGFICDILRRNNSTTIKYVLCSRRWTNTMMK